MFIIHILFTYERKKNMNYKIIVAMRMKYRKGENMALPTKIEVRGARVRNLKNIDVDIPLHKFVAISGLSGSGKSSLAMGIPYEEGSRHYLDLHASTSKCS